MLSRKTSLFFNQKLVVIIFGETPFFFKRTLQFKMTKIGSWMWHSATVAGTTSQNYMGLYTIKLNHNSLLTSKLTTIIEIDRDILLGLHHIVNWLKKCQEVSHGSSSIDFVVVAKTIDLNCKVHTIHLLHLIGWILDFCSAKIYSGMKR